MKLKDQSSFQEGLKVWVCSSNSGYTGPAILMGLVFGKKWLVKTLSGDEKIITADADQLKEIEGNPLSDENLSKDEKKKLKKKVKTERKNHQSNPSRRR